MTNEVFSVTQKHTPKERDCPSWIHQRHGTWTQLLGNQARIPQTTCSNFFWKPGRNINQLRNTTTTTKTCKQTKNTQKIPPNKKSKKKTKTHNSHTNPTHSLLLNKNVHIMLYCFHLILHSMMTLVCLFLPTLSSIHKDPYGPRALRTPNFEKCVLPEVMH